MNNLLNRMMSFIVLSFTFLSYANAQDCPALFYAVKHQQEDIVETHLSYGADPNASLENCPIYPFPEGSTLLHIAAYLGNRDIFSQLENKEETNIFATDDDGYTAYEVLLLKRICQSNRYIGYYDEAERCFSTIGRLSMNK